MIDFYIRIGYIHNVGRIIKLLVEKINPEPDVESMKAFGIMYNKDEWKILTDNRLFLEVFDKNLSAAKRIADKILNKV